jgi:GH3 auxin-responsive promoter
VEFAGARPSPLAIQSFAECLDKALVETNEDYAAHRAGMQSPRIRVVPKGGFAAWMKSRGKLGGQNKVPRVITDTELLRQLTGFMDRMPAAEPD